MTISNIRHALFGAASSAVLIGTGGTAQAEIINLDFGDFKSIDFLDPGFVPSGSLSILQPNSGDVALDASIPDSASESFTGLYEGAASGAFEFVFKTSASVDPFEMPVTFSGASVLITDEGDPFFLGIGASPVDSISIAAEASSSVMLFDWMLTGMVFSFLKSGGGAFTDDLLSVDKFDPALYDQVTVDLVFQDTSGTAPNEFSQIKFFWTDITATQGPAATVSEPGMIGLLGLGLLGLGMAARRGGELSAI